MARFWSKGSGGAVLVGLAAVVAAGQMHKVTKPETVVRATGVYEWTGDVAKPTASRLIPVSLYIEGRLEDAGVYLARPIPFALLPGNDYELEQGGVKKGSLELAFARHVQAADGTGEQAFDDGWFGYGAYKAPRALAKKQTVLRAAKDQPVITSSKSDNPDRPSFAKRGGAKDSGKDTAGADGDKSTPPADPDRPTMKRRDDTGASAGTGDSSTKGDASTAGSGTAGGTGKTPAEDPDRPTMKRRDERDDDGERDGYGFDAGGRSGPADAAAAQGGGREAAGQGQQG